MEAAEAMPEEKFSFRPSPEVRTFGEQLRHIAAVQWTVAAGLLAEPVPVDVGDGDSGPAFMTAKAEILKYLRDSFAFMRRGISTLSAHNHLESIPHPFDPKDTKIERLALVTSYASHGWNHYGQLVVYLRMNGVRPPDNRTR